MKALTLLRAALAYSAMSSARIIHPRAEPNGQNPFTGMTQFINPDYADRVGISAQAFLASDDKNVQALYDKAKQIQNNNPTWTWLDHSYKAPQVDEYLQLISTNGTRDGSGKLTVIGTFVIYNLPNRECGTGKYHGDLENSAAGEESYKEFIDMVKDAVSKYPDVQVAFIIEPEAITNMVHYKNNEHCKGETSDRYKSLIKYTITTLTGMDNVHLYLDAGDSGTLGNDDKISDVVKIVMDIYTGTLKSPNLRGLSLNVGRRNKWILPECEAPDAKGDCDESHYANALSSLIKNDWDVRFIIDQSRSGVPPKLGASLQHTCNIRGAGFGNFPGSATNDPLADSFVWAKPGGQSDGTNDKSSPNYNPDCDFDDSLKGKPTTPGYGEWFLEAFQELIQNADPPIVPASTN